MTLRMNLWVFDTFERRLETQVAQTAGKRYPVIAVIGLVFNANFRRRGFTGLSFM